MNFVSFSRSALRALPLLWLGCSPCGGDAREVEGAHPYVRCGLNEPREGAWQAGPLSFTAEGRSLRVEGLARFAVLAGSEEHGALDGLPDVPVVVLGGATAPGLVAALGERVVFLLPGGDDDAEAYDELLDELDDEARDRVVDLSGVHELVLGAGRFVVLPGAPLGRYAVGDGSCGFGEPDIEQRSESEGDGPRWLLSWASPLGSGPHAVDRGLGGRPAGDAHVGRLAEAVGATGGLFAFPRTTAGLAASLDGQRALAAGEWAPDLAVVAPLLGGPTVRFDESSLDADFLLVEVGPTGLRVVPDA